MSATPEQVAREWWNAHWASSDGTAIATLAALLATREAEVRERCAAIVLDEVDGAEEERARNSLLSRIVAAIRALGENPPENCRECNAPFNNANPTASGLCAACQA